MTVFRVLKFEGAKSLQYTDRNYMESSHMKPWKEMLLTVVEKVTTYLTQLKEQNV